MATIGSTFAAEDQPTFENVYAENIKSIAAFQDERNELKLLKELSKFEKKEKELRAERTVSGWSCTVDEVRRNSRSYDSKLWVRHKEGPAGNYLLICSNPAVRYLLLYDRSAHNAKYLEEVVVGRAHKFSGQLGVLPRVARFHSDLLPPTFIVQASRMEPPKSPGSQTQP
jgi:hypothetical protein